MARPSAASAPREALLLYNAYFIRSSQGERLGITTLAPASIPRSRPSGARVAKAVVAGMSASGSISRKMESNRKVCSMLPGADVPKGVS